MLDCSAIPKRRVLVLTRQLLLVLGDKRPGSTLWGLTPFRVKEEGDGHKFSHPLEVGKALQCLFTSSWLLLLLLVTSSALYRLVGPPSLPCLALLVLYYLQG